MLTQKSRMMFLEETIDFAKNLFSEKKLRRKLKKDENYDFVADIVKNMYDWTAKITKEKPNITKLVPEKDEYDIPFVTVEIPLATHGRTTYVDNSKEPGKALLNDINNWIELTKSTIQEAKEQEGIENFKVVCNKIEVAASTSRLRNTGNYEGKTWKQLSKDRAETVYQILVEKLNGIGVEISPNVQKILKGGTNESNDGTSGPDPAKSFMLRNGKTTNYMGYSKDGSQRLSGSDEKRDKQGYSELMNSSVESDQYKFCLAEASLTMSYEIPDLPEPVDPQVIVEQGYFLSLQPIWKKPPKFKPMKLKEPKGMYKGPKGGNFNTKVPKAGGYIVDFKRAKDACKNLVH